jgi:hypothetical protein
MKRKSFYRILAALSLFMLPLLASAPVGAASPVATSLQVNPLVSCPVSPSYAQTLMYPSYQVKVIGGYHTVQTGWTYCGKWNVPNGIGFEWVVAKNSAGQTIYTNNGGDTLVLPKGTCNGNPCWQQYYGTVVYSYWVVENLCYQGIHVSQVNHLNIFIVDSNNSPISPTETVPGSALPQIC